MDKRDAEHNAKRQQITGHSNGLIDKYNEFAPNNPKLVDYTWEEYLQGFRYRRELLQHLITGHKQIYDLYNKTVESEKSHRQAFSSIINKVSERIRKEVKELGIPENPVEGKDPTFDEEGIVYYIVEEIQIDSWKGFSAGRDKYGGRTIKSNHKLFRTNSFDQRLLDSLVLKLNDTTRSPDISDGVSKCRSAQNTRDICRRDFEGKFGTLLRGVELRTKSLMGACNQCLHLYDAKDIARFQPLLSQ